MKKKWSSCEIKYLKKLYEINGLSCVEIYPLFIKKYNRTNTSIKIKIKKLKLCHTKKQISEIKSRLNAKEKNGMFGKVSPMKGLTKKNSEMMRNKSIKLSKTRIELYKKKLLPDISGNKNPMYGKKSWNNGLNKYTNESLKILGEKSSLYQKNKWNLMTDEEKKKKIKLLNCAMIQTKKPTKIEIKMKNFLDEYKIRYEKSHTINNFLVDFYLFDYNFVIECDGDYWHANPKFYTGKQLTNPQIKNIERDIRKNKMLINENIPFLRFWEDDINKNFDSIKNQILSQLFIKN